MRLNLPVSMTVGALLTVSLSACMDSASIHCSPGEFYCPATQRCSSDGTSCLALKDSCGDGERQAGEACDDGNTRDYDGCNHSCTSDESCGNGFRDPNEACDDGNRNDNDGCNQSCTSNETCGNGVKDLQEVCDDGNLRDSDGCSKDCLSTEFCGNGYVDTAKGEKCDDGNNDSGDGCSGDCRSDETCGNGYIDVTNKKETCDDGNTRSRDGCSSDCQSNETCGNNYTDPWEACDDGNRDNTDQCSSTCTVIGEGCGNGRVDATEECDDGDNSNDNTCLNTCVLARCGDGVVSSHAIYPEQCDPGTPDTDTATCTRACRLSTCGDRYINIKAGELCEDGNNDDCGTCNSTCRSRNIPSIASGFIDATDSWKLTAGETFTVDDGLHPAVVFEFTNKNPAQGHVKIPIQGSAVDIAQSIIAAINSLPNFDINASLSSTPGENDHVILEHAYPTALGNRRITHTVQDSSFFTQGMTGGAAKDCSWNMNCTVDDDCRPGLHCQTGSCVQ